MKNKTKKEILPNRIRNAIKKKYCLTHLSRNIEKKNTKKIIQKIEQVT